MLVLHANWSGKTLCLWAESLRDSAALREQSDWTATASASEATGTAMATQVARHPFAVDGPALLDALRADGLIADEDVLVTTDDVISVRLPGTAESPWPSDRLEQALGHTEHLDDAVLEAWAIPVVRIRPDRTLAVLLRLRETTSSTFDASHEMRYWTGVGDLILDLMADQRFIPTLIQSRDHELRAGWRPWIHEAEGRARAGQLILTMPAVVRSTVDDHDGHPWRLLTEVLDVVTDATIRRVLIDADFGETVEGRTGDDDPHVAWLIGLLGDSEVVPAMDGTSVEMLRDAGRWIAQLDEASEGRPVRLALRLEEPPNFEESEADGASWRLSFGLLIDGDLDEDGCDVMLAAERIWADGGTTTNLDGQRLDRPQEHMLSELSRAGRIYPSIETALSETTPSGIDLTTRDAYRFLREYRPVLEEAGFTVTAPSWWDQPASRIGLRLVVAPTEATPSNATSGLSSATNMLGLGSLVKYQWQVAVGDQPLSADAFRRLMRQSTPLVRVNDQWVEINAEDMQAAAALLEAQPEGEMTLLEAFQAAHGMSPVQHGLPVFGLDASGWIEDLIIATGGSVPLPDVTPPDTFKGVLRPYQQRGLQWLSFLDDLGLGACLADDMGLGKTIQLIALLLHERAMLETEGSGIAGPTLLIVPTSLIGNWSREIERFAPSLTYHIQHGPDRPTGPLFAETAASHDVVMTTYALVARDQESLTKVMWRRVVLDEGQYIKNPPTKQTSAIRSLHTHRRVVLTGTPVENRLSELWSIMEFCNPGYLGHQGDFRRRFAIPIERRRDAGQGERLRHMVRPFILRRLKTDPDVIQDLPDCVETKEYATLTAEQASLYQNVVDAMLAQVDRAEGIQRRGLVLAALTRLKQICNHPAQFLNAPGADALGVKDTSDGSPLYQRSGKTQRLLQLLEEVLAVREKTLIFTQFRQMGHLLTAMIQRELDAEAIFLHGGTPQKKRQGMIDRFQSDEGPPVFVLSLKAGGVGLNLTAANHVFHFDRWWNPAVEKQATDRAFRIGQSRTVHVHKFVCMGTLEERIDQMIEQKMELAENIIGSGEDWLTELSTGKLQELLQLRSNAMEGDVT